MSFATPAQLLAQHDARTIGNLAGDQGQKITSDQLLTNDNVQQALDQATGRMTVAFRVGQRYSAADLATLITTDGPSAAYLAYICAEIAYGILWNRRADLSRTDEAKDARENCERLLKELRTGEAIFDIDANTEASLPKITGPSRQTIRNLNSVAEYGRGRVFPLRRLPNNR